MTRPVLHLHIFPGIELVARLRAGELWEVEPVGEYGWRGHGRTVEEAIAGLAGILERSASADYRQNPHRERGGSVHPRTSCRTGGGDRPGRGAYNWGRSRW